MKKPLRIGLIGGGARSAIGPAHVAAIRMDGLFDIGPCRFSENAESNSFSHQKYGITQSEHCADLEAWLDTYHQDLDLVALLTPSTDHAVQIDQVAKRGLSLITEKPAACTVSEVEQVRASLTAHPDVQARFVHNYSGYPMFREMVLRLQAGEIGKVHSLRIEMPSDGFARQKITGNPQYWRQKDPDVPMIMLDLGTHMHHLVQMAIGPCASRVSARMHKLVNTLGVYDNVEIWEERTDGIEVTYWMSKAHLGAKNGLKIEAYGDEGMLGWYQMDPDQITQVDLSSNPQTINRGAISAEAGKHDRFKAGHPTGFVEAFANFYADVAEDLSAPQGTADDHKWICSIEQAFDGIKFLSAAAKSHHSGQWVTV